MSRRHGAVQWHCLGYVESQVPVDECIVHTYVINFGHANQLGAFTGTAEFFPNFCEDFPKIIYTGTFDWFAANGDEITGTFEGDPSPTGTSGVYDNHETAEVTGGTGRFAHATGHFELGGQLDFTTKPPSFVLPWQGVLQRRIDEAALDIAAMICASQLAFV